jgi:adenosylmethionine-8-amino-7-oxononanoate aminotransferase
VAQSETSFWGETHVTSRLATTALKNLDRAHHLHPFTDFQDYAHQGGRIISRAEHVYIYDSDGNKIQDGMSGLWCCNLGYSQNSIKEAVAAQLNELPFYNNFFKCSNQPAVELASALCKVSPAGFNHVFFYQLGIRGERHPNQTCPTLLRPAGQAQQETYHQSKKRLPRLYHCRRLTGWHVSDA